MLKFEKKAFGAEAKSSPARCRPQRAGVSPLYSRPLLRKSVFLPHLPRHISGGCTGRSSSPFAGRPEQRPEPGLLAANLPPPLNTSHMLETLLNSLGFCWESFGTFNLALIPVHPFLLTGPSTQTYERSMDQLLKKPIQTTHLRSLTQGPQQPQHKLSGFQNPLG